MSSDLHYLVDPKGIEPSNLTDANRALSQLSYGPITSAVCGLLCRSNSTVTIIAYSFEKIQSYFQIFQTFFSENS